MGQCVGRSLCELVVGLLFHYITGVHWSSKLLAEMKRGKALSTKSRFSANTSAGCNSTSRATTGMAATTTGFTNSAGRTAGTSMGSSTTTGAPSKVSGVSLGPSGSGGATSGCDGTGPATDTGGLSVAKSVGASGSTMPRTSLGIPNKQNRGMGNLPLLLANRLKHLVRFTKLKTSLYGKYFPVGYNSSL